MRVTCRDRPLLKIDLASCSRLGASHAWNDIDSRRHVQAGDFTLEGPRARQGRQRQLQGTRRQQRPAQRQREGRSDLHASTALTTLGSVPLALQGTLGWQHAYDGLDSKRQLSFAGSDSFTVKGTPLAQDTALAQLGVTAQVASGTTVGLGYSGQFGDGYTDNGVRLGLNASF